MKILKNEMKILKKMKICEKNIFLGQFCSLKIFKNEKKNI